MQTDVVEWPARSRSVPPDFAWKPVGAVAGLAGIVLLIASRHYGYFFDEAYFTVAGRDHLAWGYFDQPPLIPALAGLAAHIAPGSLSVMRLPVIVAAVAGIVTTGLIARELGGGRGAQTLAAIAYTLSSAVILTHWLATYSMDPQLWTIIVFLVLRWVRQHAEGRADDRLLLAAGVVTAVAMQTKFLVPALWVALGAGALMFGPRRLLGRPLLWAGLAIAALATAPTLVWQARNGWPYTHMSQVVAAEFPGIGPMLRDAVYSTGLEVGLPLLAIGLVMIFVDKRFRPYRCFGAAIILVTVAIVLMHGRANYLADVYALPMAAGAAVVTTLPWQRVVRPVTAVMVTAGAAVWLTAMPIYPRSWAEHIPDLPTTLTAKVFAQADSAMTDMATAAEQTYRTLTPEIRDHTAILTEIYPVAAAIDLDHAETGLPRTYSGFRGYYYFGHPSDDAVNVLYLGSPNPILAAKFTESRSLVPDFATLYTGRKISWTELWPQLRAQ
ncbi:ArnT family glycosyltransferase [Nocardia terpenica]|uniref:Glycosyltransferase RgtA/B/C/D-like domain-containing protein n=1 Tax=Nocardia terpenica TaxID=455432 RepID=A0A6G9Z508_9NOCA|nr:glycosyltransferase family 39 protein [Nocardia terpenica]QIS20481.1 hypothetical protein F6W96_21465 [Nocardia terpenica]